MLTVKNYVKSKFVWIREKYYYGVTYSTKSITEKIKYLKWPRLKFIPFTYK